MHPRLATSTLLLGLGLAVAPAAAQQTTTTQDADGAEALVRELYALVTFDAGAPPDWDDVRALFIPEAVVVLRTSRTASTVFSVDGFLEDWVRFAADPRVVEHGFIERIVRMRPMVFGDIAHILVLYEAEIPGTGRPAQQGVDSMQLILRDGRWRIASIVNEIPTPARPVPADLQPPR